MFLTRTKYKMALDMWDHYCHDSWHRRNNNNNTNSGRKLCCEVTAKHMWIVFLFILFLKIL